MDHLALKVSDQERARRFYETYCGFGSPRTYSDGTVMLYRQDFALALGGGGFEPHFGQSLPDRDAVHAMAERLRGDGVEILEQWDEPDYVSVKVHDPDGHIVEFSWEPKTT
jgi:catechol 2,3-dioxygenase-like lactoylglutathione lyase family enzyme